MSNRIVCFYDVKWGEVFRVRHINAPNPQWFMRVREGIVSTDEHGVFDGEIFRTGLPHHRRCVISPHIQVPDEREKFPSNFPVFDRETQMFVTSSDEEERLLLHLVKDDLADVFGQEFAEDFCAGGFDT